ncbi:MAG: type II secretion system F family protein [Candidatus Nanohaloarchaeota archaeon QJJ-7]|nr:type II secretion system F family protein [Candidatus Nanohaloarchaeota archaeon QJJ-7]
MELDVWTHWQELPMIRKVELASFGAGGLLLLLALIVYSQGGPDQRVIGGSLFVAGLVTAFLPYGIYSYFREKKYRQMENELPLFLRNLSEGIKGGMSMPQAFQHATETDYGKLDAKIERASHQLSWGVPFPEVMERMSRRLEGSGLIRRSISIILQSYESGGDIAETLDSIAANASRIKEAEEKRRSVLQQQVYIIYAIHFLFLGILIALYLLLSSFLVQLGGGEFLGSVTNFCSATNPTVAQPLCSLCPTFGMGSATDKLCYYKSLFMIMLVVEGIFNGLVIGEITQGNVSSGVKHSLAMGMVGFVIYLVAISVL